MLNVVEAVVEVYEPGDDDEPKAVIDSDLIESASQSLRVDKWKDSGDFVFHNDGGELAGTVTSGDKLRFLAQLEDSSDLEHRFTAMARSVRYAREGPSEGEVEIEGGDFVSEVLANRRITTAFEARAISSEEPVEDGDEEGVINEIVRRRAPEIDRSQLPDIPEPVDLNLQRRKVKKVVDSVAARADAIAWGDDDVLRVEDVFDLTPKFEVEPDDIVLPYEFDITDDGLANFISVDGGDDYALENENGGPDTWTEPTDADRVTFEYRTRKSETARIELYTRSPGDEGEITVRLQAANDAGDGPIEPGEGESDVVSKTLSGEFIAEEDYTTFIFGEHTLPERDTWVIVEGDGGHEIGLDADDDPVYRQYYPFSLVARMENSDSIDEYRKREYAEDDDNLITRRSVVNRARDLLDKRATPEQRLTLTAESPRMHRLNPGEAVEISRPRDALRGTFVVIDRNDEYSGITLKTTLELQEVGSI